MLDKQWISRVKGVELTPNWFASVMGTGIIANAAAGLPLFAAQLHSFAVVVWLLSVVLLLFLSFVKLLELAFSFSHTKKHFSDPVMAQFFGAPPMALLTIAGGCVLVGVDVLGSYWAIKIAWYLWLVGTLGGLFTAVFIPYRLFTCFDVQQDSPFGGWLMPVVPPMVSAAIGALLVPHAPEGQWQQAMLLGCYAMFGLSLIAAMIIITMIWSRLAHVGSSGTSRVPTLWIILGPLGQSITALGLLAICAPGVVAPELAQGMRLMAILYGVPVWGFALLWSVIAALITVRAMRNKMPFALTWWAFTFPVGTCVTGTSLLANHTGLIAFGYAAALLFTALLFAWLLAAVGTLRSFIFKRS
ncbi:TDT family transporter [Agaribacterium sp. ZY112]|uniref:TDT family transporter n=1 Tax=Agaribacterium sp. ZY112 TaxID=3233574 RepID=UPI003524CA1D